MSSHHAVEPPSVAEEASPIAGAATANSSFAGASALKDLRQPSRMLTSAPGRTRLCLLSVIGVLAVAAFAPTTVAAATYPARAAGFGISLSVRPGGILISQPVSFTGVVPAAYVGGRVRLQRLVGPRWKLIGVDRDIASGGGFTITHIFELPSRPHEPTLLRLCFGDARPRLRTCSAPFAVRISRPAKPRPYPLRRAIARERRERHRRALESARHRREDARDRRLQRKRTQASERQARRARQLENARRHREDERTRREQRQDRRNQAHEEQRKHREEERKRRAEAHSRQEEARKDRAELRRSRSREREEKRKQHNQEQAEKRKRHSEEVRQRTEEARKRKEASHRR